VDTIEWPMRWQPEAIDAVIPHLGSDERLRILVDDPKKAIFETPIEGHVYVAGPVLRIELLRPRRRPFLLYAHPDWKPGGQ
jgi:hypothetical protein